MKNLVTIIIFLVAAVLETGGDALIRKGMRGLGVGFIAAGIVALGSYGVVVNTVRWDFSKLLGVYVAVFAVMSIFFSLFFFKEAIPTGRWIGMTLVIIGGLIIQFWNR